MMQIAIAKGLIWCTADIKAAYLNVPRPAGEIPILSKLEPLVEICGLDPNQLYRIEKCLYGLPDSGRHFYRHYREALIKEEYIMSSMDNCLFYKITEEEITFIVLFVDDTLIFSKRQIDIDQFVVCMNRHYELPLDTKADSFLGINIGHNNEDGTVTLTQPKLLQKLFKEHPEQSSKRKAKTPTHPYGPVSSHNKEKEQSPPILVTTYLRLLGLLMYLTKSRPDIMAAVSFGATKSTNPTEGDYQQLYYIVDYLRVTASKGHRIFVHAHSRQLNTALL